MEGKVIAITGGASGMGLATAKILASRGANVSIADINEKAAKTAVESLTNSDKHMYTVVDVRNSDVVDAWIKSTLQKYGKLDGAVNMAGVIGPTMPVSEMSNEKWDFEFSVNVRGVMNCMRAQLRAMIDRKGSIVSAASTFGQEGSPGNSAYCASKAAVIGLSRAAAKENANVRINCVAPGSVNTPLSAGEDPEELKSFAHVLTYGTGENPDDVKRGLQRTIQKRQAEPTEVANVIAFLLSDEASFVTGAVYNVDGGWVC